MAGKVGTTKHETEGLEYELDETKDRLEAVTKECARWKDRTVELQQVLRRFKLKETQAPNQISKAVDSALVALTTIPTTNSGNQPLQPLPPSGRRVEGRVFELVNELVFDLNLPTSAVAGIVGSVSRATVGVCYGDLVDDVDIDMGEHYEFDEYKGSSVPEVAVAGPSSVAVPPIEYSGGEGA